MEYKKKVKRAMLGLIFTILTLCEIAIGIKSVLFRFPEEGISYVLPALFMVCDHESTFLLLGILGASYKHRTLFGE